MSSIKVIPVEINECDTIFGFGFEYVKKIQKIKSSDISLDIDNDDITKNEGEIGTYNGIPVMSLARKFEFEVKVSDLINKEYLVIVELAGGNLAGFLVDKVSEPMKLRPTGIKLLPKSFRNKLKEDFFWGVVLNRDEDIILLVHFDYLILS